MEMESFEHFIYTVNGGVSLLGSSRVWIGEGNLILETSKWVFLDDEHHNFSVEHKYIMSAYPCVVQFKLWIYVVPKSDALLLVQINVGSCTRAFPATYGGPAAAAIYRMTCRAEIDLDFQPRWVTPHRNIALL
jgi:hypothetical protein